MRDPQANVEFRIMPSGNGRWYWEIVTEEHEVVTRGLSDNEPAACQDASDAARKAKLIR
jgi:hypothetical protein